MREVFKLTILRDRAVQVCKFMLDFHTIDLLLQRLCSPKKLEWFPHLSKIKEQIYIKDKHFHYTLILE
jgi:hypothetical protein